MRFGLVKICLKLKRIFKSNIGILVNFGNKIEAKYKENGEIIVGNLLRSKVAWFAEVNEENYPALQNQEDDAT